MLSTQQANKGIPLNHRPSATGYKLLELPPELLALLEPSDRDAQPPPALRLEPSPTAALLRSPDGRTWSLRQKNTSNALILLRPSGEGEGEGGDKGAGQQQSLDAFATVHETVELVPEAEAAAAPVVAAKGKWHERFGRTR